LRSVFSANWRAVSPTRLEQIQQWEGVVLECSEEGFVGQMNHRGESAEFVADFLLEELAPADRELVREGALFYLSVGYDRTRRASPLRVASVQMRRLPRLHRDLVERAREIARERAQMMDVADAERPTAGG
jgi:hypothetical protein